LQVEKRELAVKGQKVLHTATGQEAEAKTSD